MVLQHWSWQPPFSVVHSFTSVGRKHIAVSKEWVLATLPGYLRTITYDPDVTKWESYGEVQLRTLKATTGAVTPSYSAVPPNSTKRGNGGISPPHTLPCKVSCRVHPAPVAGSTQLANFPLVCNKIRNNLYTAISTRLTRVLGCF